LFVCQTAFGSSSTAKIHFEEEVAAIPL